jgi:ribose transport system ATP-binding protein
MPVFRLEGIVKRFAGVTALDGVDFTLARGQVHALVGENGAGKSTLVKIMTGAYRRDNGAMWLDGARADFQTPADAQAAGVIAVHQEVHLLPHRTVAENVFLGREPRRWGVIRWQQMFNDTAALFGTLGVDIDPRAALGTLRTAQQQLVAIARGVSLGAKVVVLDEPTSSLSDREAALLFTLIRRLTAGGTSVVYISHRFDELYTICDHVTVLRDGKFVATSALAAVERFDLVCLMLGKSREQLEQSSYRAGDAAHTVDTNETPLFHAEALRRGARLRGVSLAVRRGEVVGLTGLLGAGRSETARAIFGADPAHAGTMTLHARPYAPKQPRDAMALRVAFLSEDRKAEGIIPELSVRENLTLATLPSLTRWGVVNRARERALVDEYMRLFGIKARSPDQPIRELSGGNQQKVLLARWLCTRPELFVIDEPTRGIDIGARGEIQRLIHTLAANGLGVLMISSDLEEIIENSSRVVVLRDGVDVAVIDGATLVHSDVAQDTIIRAMAHGISHAPEVVHNSVRDVARDNG